MTDEESKRVYYNKGACKHIIEVLRYYISCNGSNKELIIEKIDELNEFLNKI